MRKSISQSNPLFERGRFRIMAYLAGIASKDTTFNEIKRELCFTQGNLSVQLQILQKSGFIRITKDFYANKSRTTINVTDKGIEQLKNHLEEMQSILVNLNKGAKK